MVWPTRRKWTPLKGWNHFATGGESLDRFPIKMHCGISTKDLFLTKILFNRWISTVLGAYEPFGIPKAYAAFKTSLPIPALPLLWWFLYNCTNATRHREKTKRWAASSQSINLTALPTAADHKPLTSIQIESNVAQWTGQAAESFNSETASGDQAM